MTKVLNITNGDTAANVIRQSRVAGEVLPWRDPMHHGPFPAALSLGKLSEVRADYLSGPHADPATTQREFLLRDERLRASLDCENVTLWFEHDLLDQLQILQILDWFSGNDLGSTTLELICIDRFPGNPNFRGIGQLNTEEMSSLSGLCQPVTAGMLDLAASGWAVFRSGDPNDLLSFLEEDLSELPFLAAALRRHVEEFPNATTGLNRTETQLLRLMEKGVHAPGQLFLQNMDMEAVLFMGDWPTYRVLDALCCGGLVTCDPSPFCYPPSSGEDLRAFREQRLSLTEAGERVLIGENDAFGLMRRDYWLGGVKLTSSDTIWAWDENAVQFSGRAI